MADLQLHRIFEELRDNVPGTQAILWIGPDGAILEHFRASRSVDIEALAAEYATLSLIAQRTSEDAGGGKLREYVVVSDTALTIVQSFEGHFLVVVSATNHPVGRVRWELKRAARQIASQLRVPEAELRKA